MDDKRKLLLSLLKATAPAPAGEGVAIVGVAGRYPLAGTVTELWDNLADGRHCIREVPADRWNADAHHGPGGTRGGDSRWAGFIDEADMFDPLFFRISPAEAEAMDPQERLFLQTASAALEDAGIPAATLAARGPVGVFVGVMNNDYEWLGGEATALGAANSARSAHYSVANRVSYVLDFTGPSLAVDTACSASLTAVHLACESIRSGDCVAAVAGGVNLILHQGHLGSLAEHGMISRGDRLKAFGADADGFVDGEGVGAVLLKPLRAAVADGDRILGVIRGSAVNANGKTGGYTVPSSAAQSRVIGAALRRAGVTADTIGYVEAHGTGTPLGDPIEITGLVEAFGGRIDPRRRAERPTVAVGSVKTNIGHLESAAGIAGLTKVLLQLGHGKLAPSLHSQRPNPAIDFTTTPFHVQQSLAEWPRLPGPDGTDGAPELPRRALVSSFGGGGANACVLVEEYLPAEPMAPAADDGEHLLVLSAKTEERLRAYAADLAAWLRRSAARGPATEPDPDATAEVRSVCLRLAAETVGVEPRLISPAADLAEYGFGVTERARYHALLAAEFGAGLPPVATTADTVEAVARAVAVLHPGAPATDDGPCLADIGHTLRSGRTAHEFRLALTTASPAEAAALLETYAAGRTDTRLVTGRAEATRTSRSAADTADLDRALTVRDLTAVAAHWVVGAEPDWSRLTPPGARRIALPTYPFARRRCWIPAPPALHPEAQAPARSALEPPDFYRPVWVRADTPAKPVPLPPRRVVVLTTEDSSWLGEALAARLPAGRVECVRLDGPAGDHWTARTTGADLVYHLGGVHPGPGEGLGEEQAARQMRSGPLALLRLLRDGGARRQVVVTSDAYGVAGSTVRNPFAAGLHGMLQVAPKERPGLRAVGLDFAWADAERDPEALVDALLAEPLDGTGRTVALRAGVRYTRRLGRVELPEAGPVFRDGGVYLLVGGTGGIARELSLHLAERHRARLVWFSRGALTPALEADIARIRAYGGEVAHVRGDACSATDLAAAVAETHSRFGAVHGVVHAAMVFDNHALADLDDPTFTAVTAVKSVGAAALAAAVAGERLDFLTYFSSAGSFGGFAGNGAYACASATEDAYAHFLRDRLPFPVSVVNQGYWGQVGSGTRSGLAEIFAGLGIGSFTPAEGIAALRRVLHSGLAQVMPIRAGHRALEAMGHDPAYDGEVMAGGHAPALAEAFAGLRSQTGVDPAAARVVAGYQELETVSAPALLDVYRRMGVFGRSGERHHRAELHGRLRIQDKYRRLHEALLNILTDAGYLTRDGEHVVTAAAVDAVEQKTPGDREAEFGRICAAYPDIEPTVTLNRLFLEEYPRILRGEVGATEIMFPGSSMKLVQNFYKGNPLTDSFNVLVGETVRRFLDLRLPQLPAGATVDVVELGAGTGATSERVLPVLAEHADRVGYTFTDISPRFLEHGRERFAARYPFARFQVLNLERGLLEQDFIPASADLVVATNVVHATRNLRATLRRAKALLRPGGWLVLNELTGVRPLLTIGGGPLEGWWAFEDGELRLPDSPLASPESWIRLLHEEGYAPVGALGSDDTALGQSVLVAESDGLVLAATPPASPPPAPATAPAPTPPPAPGTAAADEAAERLRGLVEGVLKLEERIDPDRPLADYGFDSLSGMKIVSAVDEAFGVTVPLGDFFERPTLRELSAHLTATWLADVAPTAVPESQDAAGAVTSPTAAVAAEAVLRPRSDAVAATHPLSEGQRALWVIEQIAPGTYAYNLPLALWLDPGTDLLALRVVLQDLVDRHAELRATVRTSTDGPLVSIAAEPELPFQQVFLTAVADEALRDRMRTDLRAPFDLTRGPLVRATLYTLGDGRQALLLTFHHLVFDGVSIAALLKELERGYRTVTEGRPLPPDRPARTYADFTARQREVLAGAQGERLRAYWLERLRGRQTAVALPLDRPRPPVPGFRGASVDGHIPRDVAERARALATAEQTSLFGVLLAAFFAVLHRYTDQDDLAVGTPTAGRPADGFEDVLGYFMNMVVLAERIDPQEPFRALTRRVHRTVLEALEHGEYPLITLAEELKRADPAAPAAPFNVAFYFQNWARGGLGESGLVLAPVEGVHQEGEFDLTLEVVEAAEGCRYSIKYDPDLFDEATAERFGAHFTTLLAGAVAAPGTAVGGLDPLTAEEYEALARPAADYPSDTLVWELVRRQAEDRPDAVAVRCDGTELTYRQLQERVGSLAARLTAAGVGRGRTVGVLLPRDAGLPVALLAVQAAGGAYVPLDPAYPAERLAYMAEDAGLHLMLTHSTVPGTYGSAPSLLADGVDGAEEPPAAPSPGPAGPDDPAYVIYTSGSTGRPKGVSVPHRALTNFLWSMAREPGCGPGDTLLAVTTVCFDISGLELYLPLVTGGTVEVLPADSARDGLRLREAVERIAPTIVQATPATWTMLLAAGWCGHPDLKVLSGGEALPAETAEALLAGNGEVWNLYGPTETTIWSAASRLVPNEPVTLGAPIANTALYVLDGSRRPVPTGVAGELYIAGHGVADGYLGRPDLTAERFLPDPFAPLPGGRMYRTGDLVRRLADGRLVYLGRIDSQVKVRGFRVELEEIEATLRRLDGVREAVAVARGSGGDRTLLACFVSEEGAADPTRERLAAWLPTHMVPDVLLRVSGFPRTLNGKVDRTALATRPLPELRARFGTTTSEPHTPPAPPAEAGETGDRVEALLAELTGTVARLAGTNPRDIGAHTPLGEAGMTSVTFTTLSVELRTAYGIDVPPTLFYRRSTLAALAEHLWEHHADTLGARFGPAAAPRPTVAAAEPAGEERRGGDVAIIGMAGRLPGSMDLDEFWDHLVAGDDLVTEIPADRWDWRAQSGSRSRWGGFVPDVDRFDAAFFGISPREAELMDPQQRLMLETAWSAIEDAGYRPSDLAGKRVGVFVAATNSDYLEVQRAAGRGIEGHTLTGAALSVIPNRISYLLDLRGPSIAVDTACSGSLTAVHQAVAALRDGTCDLALAGGVSLMLAPTVYEALSRGEMLSPDGRCKAFDRRADGYVRGEGAGLVLLKPDERARRDGDAVHAVIKAVAIHHGGRTTSLTAPNPDAQADLLVEAYHRAGVEPRTVGLIEAHGTGTALGDPIETIGLSSAFRRLRADRGEAESDGRPAVAIGSVKTNIGHLEAAAGIAGLLKTVLALRNGTIPASLHFAQPNPHLELDGGPFEIARTTRPWPRPRAADGRELPRNGGVSSFGFGGAGAHIVLEEPTVPEPCEEPEHEQVFVLSARDPEALGRSARRLVDHLSHHDIPAGDLAHTLQTGREAMTHRLAVVASTTDVLRAELTAHLDGRPSAVRTGLVQPGGRTPTVAATAEPHVVASAWLTGAEVDWTPPREGRRRVHLPTYPFARTRHWVTPATPPPTEPAEPAGASGAGAFADAGSPAVSESLAPAGAAVGGGALAPSGASVPAGPSASTGSAVGAGSLVGAGAPADEVAAFAPVWEPDPRTTPADAVTGTVLVLDTGVHGAEVAAALTAVGAVVRRVSLNAGFEPGAVLDAVPPGPLHVVLLAGEDTGTAAAVEHGFHAASDLLRAWQRHRRGSTPHLLYVHRDPASGPAQPAMAGFVRSVRREHPSADVRVLAVAAGQVADAVTAELGADGAPEVRVGEDGRTRRAWRHTALPGASGTAFAGDGAHIITGGTGALGLLLAEHIAAGRRAAGLPAAGIMLVARSAPGPEARARIEAAGARVVLADVADPGAVRALVADARATYGSVSGVLHAAGVLRDGLLRSKARADAEAVLAAKVYGTVLLDEATRDEPLDYFVAFSSAAAAFGNLGQTDYAFANAFLDHFAEQREQLRLQGARRGRTLAAAWPVWADGGMRITAAAEQDMARELGMRPVRTSAGLVALERALAGTAPRLLLAPGDPARILAALDDRSPGPRSAAPAPGAELRLRAERLVLRLLAAELRLPEREIAVNEPFDHYGVDSLITMSLVRRLEEHVGPLPKTLLFEYVTAREVADHLAAARPDAFAEQEEPGEPAEPVGVRTPTPAPVVDATAPADVAIIGVAGRYPQADDIDEFWRNLREGRDCVEEVPADRWDHARFYDLDKSAVGRTYGRWGGFLRGADRFDPLFFRMSQLEAEHVDPQERVFLETVWHLLEDAGCTRERLRATRTGVFVGVTYGHYQLYGVRDALRGTGLAASSSHASVANRVSYFFGFTGPSIALDTMCSSSLVALHQAWLAIRNGDCDAAVAGGVNVSTHPVKYLQLAHRGFLAEDGRCRSFGEGGTGYVPAEGSGAVLLKRLDRAVADGDRILAVIRGSAVNHGGTAKGFSVPSPKAQGELLRTALERSGLRPADLDYLEAHGTGTALGDPIEVAGVLSAFGGDLPERLPIGSVKSNIGHAESAAGIAAVTKVLLQMRHGEFAPSLHADRLNPNIDFAATPLHVQSEAAPWPRRVLADGTQRPRTAGVSSFGAGGTNAHVVLQEHLDVSGDGGAPVPGAGSGPYLAVLSARDGDRLAAQARRLAAHLRGEGAQAAPQEVAWTLQWGREAMEHRFAVLFDDLPQLADRLEEFAAGGTPAGGHSAVADLRRSVEAATPAADPAGYAEAWTAGRPVDWPALYPAGLPCRVALPGYPFAGDRIRHAAIDAELGAPNTTPADPAAGVLLTRQWIPAPPARGTALPRLTAILTVPGTEAVAARLSAALPGGEVLTPERLAADLADPGTRWERYDAVADLSGCGDPALPPAHGTLPVWLRWLQHLVDRGGPELRTLLVSRGPNLLGGAARAGLYRMLQSEYGHVRSRHLDAGICTDEQLSRWTVGELGALAGDEDPAEIAYHDGVRHRAVLRPLLDGPRAPLSFPEGHVLWVTGGTRGLGLLTARHFVARHGVRKVVLTGREELPPRAEWGAHIAEGGPLGQRLRPLAELAEQGVELEVLAVRLEEKEALAKTLADIRLRLGPTGGVIHCAGFNDARNPAFVRKPQAVVDRVVGPKVFGLDALVECFRDEPLSLFVVYSSVAAAVPALAVGQSDYAMANAYMDAVAEARPHGLPIQSIQWPSWKDTGMGEVCTAAYRASGLAALSDEQGLALLERALGSGTRVVLPAVARPDAVWQPDRLTDRHLDPGGKASVASVASLASLASLASEETAAGLPEPGPGATVLRAVSDAAADWLLGRLAAELRFDRSRLTGDVPVQDYGVDSIVVAQLVQETAKRLDVSLDPSALLEHPTADAFTQYLAQSHPDALLAAFAPDPGDRDSRSTASCADTVVARPAVPTPAAGPAARGAGDIAVVGLSCRFPGAESADAYWELLREGGCALRPAPESVAGTGGHHAGLLPDVLRVDPDTFLLSEADAAAMDPQALLLLEEVNSALHHAGYRPDELKGHPIGVYVGGRTTRVPDAERLRAAANPVVAAGQNYLAANVSQFFDLRGPSLVVDTACSSALVAMDTAVQALRSGDIEAAVVAGVSLLADDRAHRVFGQRGLLNPGERFHVFDRRAAGVVLGEGIGVVVLKPLAAARADGDRVLAVLKGLAVNNDGRTAGPATPNPQAHRAVMTQALRRSGHDPKDVGWVEANGSGSVVTDLLELKAVEAVYGTDPGRRVALGSVKPNIGHPLAAEGIAAFIKVVLMLHHGEQVPFLSGQEPPVHFDLNASPLYFPRQTAPWPTSSPLAALNCFADGGTNAHLLLAPAPADGESGRAPLPQPALHRRLVVRGEAGGAGRALFWEGRRTPGPDTTPSGTGLFWDAHR
ncbi:amino acid adenylation domain-containing protein [Streptomyces sp. ATMOS53]